MVGDHTREILTELGFDDELIRQLCQSGVAMDSI